MEPHPEKNNRFRWLTSRKPLVVLTALGLLILAFQLNKLLSSSFRLEIFGIEIIEVQKLEAHEHKAPAAALPVLRPRPAPRAPLLPTEPEEPTPVFVVVENMPELIGGLAALQRKIRYPVIARKAGVEGRVFLQFIIDEQGRLTKPEVIRGIGVGCDEEALRVLRTARFRPGTQRGKPVKVKMSLPITFRLAR